MNIKDRIQQQIEHMAMIGHPALMERFILRNGQEMTPASEHGERMTPKECFSNATEVMQEYGHCTYVEGYAFRPGLPILIHHAWVMLEDGTAMDPTWDEPDKCHYYGVPFKDEDVASMMVETGYYGMFDHGRGINIDFLLRFDPGLREFMPEVLAGRYA